MGQSEVIRVTWLWIILGAIGLVVVVVVWCACAVARDMETAQRLLDEIHEVHQAPRETEDSQ
jgi:hypothetical protein